MYSKIFDIAFVCCVVHKVPFTDPIIGKVTGEAFIVVIHLAVILTPNYGSASLHYVSFFYTIISVLLVPLHYVIN
jgi:hypothetical protein